MLNLSNKLSQCKEYHKVTDDLDQELTGVEWVHCLFLFPLVLGKM